MRIAPPDANAPSWEQSNDGTIRVWAEKDPRPERWTALLLLVLCAGVVTSAVVYPPLTILLVCLAASVWLHGKLSPRPVLLYEPGPLQARMPGPNLVFDLASIRGVQLVPVRNGVEQLRLLRTATTLDVLSGPAAHVLAIARALARAMDRPLDDRVRHRHVPPAELDRPMYDHSHPTEPPGEPPDGVTVDGETIRVGLPTKWFLPVVVAVFGPLAAVAAVRSSRLAFVVVLIAVVVTVITGLALRTLSTAQLTVSGHRIRLGHSTLPRESVVAVEPTYRGVVVLGANDTSLRIFCPTKRQREWLGRTLTEWACQPPTHA